MSTVKYALEGPFKTQRFKQEFILTELFDRLEDEGLIPEEDEAQRELMTSLGEQISGLVEERMTKYVTDFLAQGLNP